MSSECERLAFLEELVIQAIASSNKPPYVWGRPGSHPDGTYLDSNGVPSNEVGIPFGLSNGELKQLWVGNKLLTSFDITLYHHLGDEVSLTSLTTVTVPAAARTKIFTPTDFGLVTIPKDVQLAARVTSSGAPTNPRSTKVYAIITGTT